MTRPCGSCLTAEFADDDADDDDTLVVSPGSEVGHLRRPSGSYVKSALGQLVSLARPDGPRTYCGRPVGDDWQETPRWA